MRPAAAVAGKAARAFSTLKQAPAAKASLVVSPRAVRARVVYTRPHTRAPATVRCRARPGCLLRCGAASPGVALRVVAGGTLSPTTCLLTRARAAAASRPTDRRPAPCRLLRAPTSSTSRSTGGTPTWRARSRTSRRTRSTSTSEFGWCAHHPSSGGGACKAAARRARFGQQRRGAVRHAARTARAAAVGGCGALRAAPRRRGRAPAPRPPRRARPHATPPPTPARLSRAGRAP